MEPSRTRQSRSAGTTGRRPAAVRRGPLRFETFVRARCAELVRFLVINGAATLQGAEVMGAGERLAGRRRGLVDPLSIALRMQRYLVRWRRRGRQDTRALRRLDQALRMTPPTTALRVAPPTTALRTPVPSIEQIAYDLRRLDRLRHLPIVAQSERWLAAVMCAYDQRLALACLALGLTEHLDAVRGVDREIERLRVEAALRDSGMRVRRD